MVALLHAWRDGDRGALDTLMPLVYAELYRIARRCMAHERRDHTLQPTELVAEVYLRLVGAALPEWSSRGHFYAVAARNMRQILVDHARRRSVRKRGGGDAPGELREDAVSVERPSELLALDDALAALATYDARKAQVVELVYFAGLSQAEIAEVLDVHVSTVARDLRLAEAWLRRELDAAPAELRGAHGR